MKRIILILIIFLLACNSVKQVLKDNAKTEIVGREWEKRNPCVNDTMSYTVTDTSTVIDTTYYLFYDTITYKGKNTIVIRKVPELVTKILTIRDTVHNYIVDNRRLRIAIDSTSWYAKQCNELKIDLIKQKLETREQKTSKMKWTIAFFILLATVIIVTIRKFIVLK